jgi:hypothetical protein
LPCLPRYSTALKRCREVSRHPVSAFEQFPEHHDGRLSCLALLGSDGTAGGCPAGAQSIDFPAQPVSSRLSSSGISLRRFQFPLCILFHLVRCLLAPLLFSPGLGISPAVTLRNFQPIIGQCGAGLRRFALGPPHSHLLDAAHQEQRQHPPAPGRYQLQRGHHGTSLKKMCRPILQVRVAPATHFGAFGIVFA